MKKRSLRVLTLGVLLALLVPALPAFGGETRFRSYALVVDAGDEPLAAWQVELTYDPATVRIVGVEGGRAPWEEAPYYDPKGLEAGRMLVAAFTLAPAPPAGATRVARIHVQETGAGELSDWRGDWNARGDGEMFAIRVRLTAAADPAGRRIGATVRLVPEKGERP